MVASRATKKEAAASADSANTNVAVDRTADEIKVLEEYNALCQELNMDRATSDAAWKSYEAIKQNYSLEGNQTHWLSCALYVACHNLMLPTVGKHGTIEGNGVSLTRLLRSCKLSLIQFFNKMKKWADMANMKIEFRDKIDCLERNFAVSNVIFKKYQPIFLDLFEDPAKDLPKISRSRKQKKLPCTAGDIFEFCWVLFVRVKNDFPAISDDLVNSYHLLLSCVDFIYGNAVLSRRTDLLNKKFGNVQLDEDDLTEPPCILDQLCSVHDGIIAEVKSIREHWWKPHIKKFFEKKLLRGNEGTLSGILDDGNFELNAKNIRKDYESYVLSIGEYDERVFLGKDANEEIGTPTKAAVSETDLGERMLAAQFDGSNLFPVTPLSGKHYLRTKEQHKDTPVATAKYLVSRLNLLLAKREAEPSPRLIELFEACEKNPGEGIAQRVAKMGDVFCQSYTTGTDRHDSFAKMRLRMGIILYYKTLESILYSEKNKRKPVESLLEQDLFHRVLFACCLEIVIFSYNSQRTFPWILDTFRLEPFHFYKVIEVIIQAEESLARDVVKHLQRIEEQILEWRAWQSDSPLWTALARDAVGGQGTPTCEEVALPGGVSVATLESAGVEGMLLPGQSPLSHHKRAFVVQSPVAGDRFKSPVVAAVARRQLAFGETSSGHQITPTSPVRAGQSLLASPQKTFIQLQGQPLSVGNLRSIVNGSVVIDSQSSEEGVAGQGGARPKRTGSLALFFRKVYHIANLRLDLLCQSLHIFDEDIKRKIWTTLEHTLVKHADLMKDRHLDQLIMCSLYIVCKVLGQNKNFTDIMRHYRNQPQAASHVYRSVLLRPKSDAVDAEEADERPRTSNPPPTPTRLAGTSTKMDGEERGDLIKFYNTVFMERLQEFSLRFKRSRLNDAPPLSPLPKLRAHPQSPCRRLSENHSVFIRPLKSTPADVVTYNPSSPHKPLSYCFSRSPAKDLKAINELMRTEGERKTAIGKRLLSDEASLLGMDDDEQPPVKMQIVAANGAVNAKLGLVLGDRAQSE